MMVVVDSSALIPLARAGKLELIEKVYEEIHAPEEVYRETVEEGKGKQGTAELKEFFQDIDLSRSKDERIENIAEMEGVAKADVSVVLLAERKNEVLLANDRGLIDFARMRQVETDWVTTLILRAVKENVLDKEGGKEALYNLVDSGMNLKNKVYSRILREIDSL